MASSDKEKRRVVILTALPVEYKAVREHVADLHELTHPTGTIYEVGEFSTGDSTWQVAIVEIGVGEIRVSLEAERAIQYFQPRVVLFIGIAGGIKDVSLGDVVAATKIYAYEYGKVTKKFLPRPEVGQVTYAMEQRARAEAKKENWHQRLSNAAKKASPSVFVGPIAAGSKVVASTKNDVYQQLRQNYGDTLAIEMEGAGFLAATRANPHVDALVVRGISDLLNNKAISDAAGWQEAAARNACAFAFQVLATLDTVDEVPLGRAALEELAREKPREADTFVATKLSDLASEEEALIEQYCNSPDFPEQAFIAGYWKPNHCFNLLPASQRKELKTLVNETPPEKIARVRRDIVLFKGLDKNGQPCILHYFSGKSSTGWNTWLLLNTSRDLLIRSDSISEHLAASREEVGTFLGTTSKNMTIDYVKSLPVSICIKVNRYSTDRSVKCIPKFYIFRYAFLILPDAPPAVLQREFSIRLGAHLRQFRWYYSEELESIERGKAWKVNADVVKTLYDVFGTMLGGLADGLAGKYLTF